MPLTYDQYRRALRAQKLPAAFVDLNALELNINSIAKRASGTRIRIASKSVRCVEMLRRIEAGAEHFKGFMTYHADETAHLFRSGLNDFLLAYPVFQEQHIRTLCEIVKEGAELRVMVDLKAQVDQLQRVAKEMNVTLGVCIDLDMSVDFPGVHFGVRRSSVTTPEAAVQLAKHILEQPNLKLDALMGYEAQIAGVGDAVPGKALMNSVIRFLKRLSIPKIAERRAKAVQGIEALGCKLEIVNAGGTGSIESSIAEAVVTEVTAGSGFYSSHLFDNYSNFRHQPAVGFAIEITRHPTPEIWTCLGGGYTASGPAGPDKAVKPWLPTGAKLTANEQAGEVQTPVIYTGPEQLHIGDPILMRHAKAGEICERFKTHLLIENGDVVGEVPTYRGEGQCFM